MSEDDVWTSLWELGIIRCTWDSDQATFNTVARYLDNRQLKRIRSCEVEGFSEKYIQAATDELMERYLLGKKRLKI
jgi:hypothetical protein